MLSANISHLIFVYTPSGTANFRIGTAFIVHWKRYLGFIHTHTYLIFFVMRSDAHFRVLCNRRCELVEKHFHIHLCTVGIRPEFYQHKTSCIKLHVYNQQGHHARRTYLHSAFLLCSKDAINTVNWHYVMLTISVLNSTSFCCHLVPLNPIECSMWLASCCYKT